MRISDKNVKRPGSFVTLSFRSLSHGIAEDLRDPSPHGERTTGSWKPINPRDKATATEGRVPHTGDGGGD